MKRKSCGYFLLYITKVFFCFSVDINPSAVTLAIKNVSFAIPKDLAIPASYRPLIMNGDSRNLPFDNDTFDHIFSHPPYKDCVSYRLTFLYYYFY